MPLYDYKCSACGKVREHRQRISDEPLRECPECGGEYKRIISSVGIIFKGSGFHINDYRGGKSAESGDAKEKPSGDKASDTKGDSKSSDSTSDGSSKSDNSTTSSSSQDKQVA